MHMTNMDTQCITRGVSILWILPGIVAGQSAKGYPSEVDIPFNRKCNGTSCAPNKPYWIESEIGDNAAPPGINDKTQNDNNEDQHSYKRDDKYWLMPPFLVGACSVIVVYIFMHCIYVHCSKKKKMPSLGSRQLPPAIIISDDPTSTNSYQLNTPIVKYEGANGQTEIHPFLLCQPFDDNEWERQLEQRRRSSVKSSFRKKSFSLQIPKLFGGNQRPSVCSPAAVLDPSSSNRDPDAPKLDAQPARASICFVPVGRTVSEPSGAPSKWTELQGIVYPTVMMPKNQPVPDGGSTSTSTAGDGEALQPPPTPIIFLSGTGGDILLRRPSAQINLQPAPTPGGTVPTSVPNTSAPAPVTSTPATGTTAATVHSESCGKTNGVVKQEAL